MNGRSLTLIVAGLLATPTPALGQDPAPLRLAEAAWRNLAYDSVLIAAHAALAGPLTRPDQVRARELLAFTYAALDSADRAIEQFRQIVFLDPDRDYDPERVSPTIVQLFRIARGRELVVRNFTVDSASFVAGSGQTSVRFETTRPAEYQVRIAGQGLDSIVASGSTAGVTRVAWNAVTPAGPAPAGPYRVTVTVSQFADRYARSTGLVVRHAPLDTLPHLDRLEGLDELPEVETPPRSWLPLALTALAAGVATGTAVALESGTPGGARTELFGFDFLALTSGVFLSLRQAAPRPLPSNIEFNRRVRELLTQRNVEIGTENAGRRRQVLLTVVGVAEGTP